MEQGLVVGAVDIDGGAREGDVLAVEGDGAQVAVVQELHIVHEHIVISVTLTRGAAGRQGDQGVGRACAVGDIIDERDNHLLPLIGAGNLGGVGLGDARGSDGVASRVLEIARCVEITAGTGRVGAGALHPYAHGVGQTRELLVEVGIVLVGVVVVAVGVCCACAAHVDATSSEVALSYHTEDGTGIDAGTEVARVSVVALLDLLRGSKAFHAAGARHERIPVGGFNRSALFVVPILKAGILNLALRHGGQHTCADAEEGKKSFHIL